MVGIFRCLGPGLILSASIVGAGELIATTALGAKAGFTALWVVLVSCAVKVALQLEIGRHTLQTGRPAMQAFNGLPGWRWRGAHWTVWAWLALQPIKILQMGGIVGGVAQLICVAAPQLPLAPTAWIVAAAAAALVGFEGYRFIERTSLWLLAVLTLLTLASVAALQWTSYAFSAADLWEGLQFRFPPGALLFVVGAFGITGVGGDEIMQYSYWLIEKGYAAKTGACQPGDAEWARRARGWIRVMQFDALFSLVVYSVVTAAFYVLGAAVLARREQIPQGYDMVETLAQMYTAALGPWARWVFLGGAFAALFSTLFSALAAWTRIFADAFGQTGWIDFHNPRTRARTIAALAAAFPALWATAFLCYREPVAMVLLGGVATSVILLLVAGAALVFRWRDCLPQLRPSRGYDAALVVSVAAIATFAVASLLVARG